MAFRFETNFSDVAALVKKLAPEVSKEMRRELLAIAVETRDATREKVPSGMSKARNTGVRATVTKNGAVISAGGNKAPNSWIGAYDGAGGKSTFSHPVFPQAGSDRKTWNWAKQPTKHILEDTWAEKRTDAQARTEVAINRAIALSLGHE